MYPVTNTVRELFWSGARQVVKITFQGSGETITLTESDVMQGGLTIDRYSVSGNKIEIGSAVAAELSLKLDNLDGRFSDVVFEGAELYVQIGIRDWTAAGDTINWVPCGYFIVDEPPRTLSVINLKALDRMVKFDRAVDPAQLTFPMTVEALIQRCCALCDVTLYSGLSGLPNRAYSITAFPETEGGELTYRTLIQWCAALLGTCAFIRWDGLLTFQWYNATGLTLAPAQRYSSDLLENDITLTGVVYQDAEENRYTAGTDDYALDLTGNGLVQGSPQTVVNALGGVLRGFTYRPYTAEVKSSPFLWPMDKITYTDGEGNTHPAIVTNVTYLMNGSTGLAGVGETAQRNGYASTGALTRQQATVLERLRKLVDTDVGQQALAALQLNETIANSLGLYMTTVDESDGSTSYYFHDGATLASSSVIYTFKAGGFAWTSDWNDGSPVWSYGITRQGNALLNILTVYKLTADYIYGGTLTLGGQGNGNGVLVLLDANGVEQGRMDNSGVSITGDVRMHIRTYESGIPVDLRAIMGDAYYIEGTNSQGIVFNDSEGFIVKRERNGEVSSSFSVVPLNGELVECFTGTNQIVQVFALTNSISSGSQRIPFYRWVYLSNGNAILTYSPASTTAPSWRLSIKNDTFSAPGIHVVSGASITVGKEYSTSSIKLHIINASDSFIQFKNVSNIGTITLTEGNTEFVVTGNVAYVNGNKLAFDSSSSRRYKDRIIPLTAQILDPHRLYNLPVVQFEYIPGHPLQYSDMAGQLLPGFIAEDVAKVYPAAVIRNEQGEIESWDERRILPGVLALVQEQRRELDELKEEVRALRELVTELSGKKDLREDNRA